MTRAAGCAVESVSSLCSLSGSHSFALCGQVAGAAAKELKETNPGIAPDEVPTVHRPDFILSCLASLSHLRVDRMPNRRRHNLNDIQSSKRDLGPMSEFMGCTVNLDRAYFPWPRTAR